MMVAISRYNECYRMLAALSSRSANRGCGIAIERLPQLLNSFRVVKADLLQLWHRRGGAGDEDHARDQVVGQLGRECLMR